MEIVHPEIILCKHFFNLHPCVNTRNLDFGGKISRLCVCDDIKIENITKCKQEEIKVLVQK